MSCWPARRTNGSRHYPPTSGEALRALIAEGIAPEEAVDRWLAAHLPAELARYGDDRAVDRFKRAVQAQIHALLCGGEGYEPERQELLKLLPSRDLFVSGLTAFIAGSFGAAQVWLAPVVVLTLLVIGKVGLRAWCAAFGPTPGGGKAP